jgi:carboxyl-terminal processing protease
MKRWKIIIATAGLFVLLAAFLPNNDRLFSIAKNLEIFAELFKIINEQYVEELNPNELIKKGMDPMLDGLDPYTNYFSEDMVEDIRTSRTGQYAGIGASTKRFQNRTKVTEIVEGSPAARSGLKAGDEILRIDGIELIKITQEEAEKLVRGQAGNSVRLQVLKAGSITPIEIDIKREKIQLKTVSHFGMADPETGYIALDEFGAESSNEVKAALLQLKEKGARFLILDLRGNPGGLLDQAVSICGLFIPKGSLVVVNKGKTPESNIQYHTRSNPMEPEMPIAVLIDRGSASASEIVSGTLQDYDRAVVLGERSYGKGLVQTRRPLSFNSFSMITTAKYYTPSGRCIQALDYSNRRKDGSVGSIPDSLKKTFFTKNGRKVYDGGGVDPDIVINRSIYPELISVLEEEGHILDYGTEYQLKHNTIAEPPSFELSESVMDDFYSWIGKRTIKIEADLEKSVETFQAVAVAEGAPAILESVKDIETGLKRFRRKQLLEQKHELKKLLTKEIVSRYYFKKGAREASFKYDPELKTALDMVKNEAGMSQILAKKPK